RLLKPYRTSGGRRPYPTRKSPGALKAQIPIRTFGDWAAVKPGSMQVAMKLARTCPATSKRQFANWLIASTPMVPVE
ncbi:MAG: hypothetical protein HY331_00915, partial [Chloroflexi bacterium]|nr:hypothetical protein [Chloroflexota bacterium]